MEKKGLRLIWGISFIIIGIFVLLAAEAPTNLLGLIFVGGGLLILSGKGGIRSGGDRARSSPFDWRGRPKKKR